MRDGFRFYLGSHIRSWLWDKRKPVGDTPVCMSINVLNGAKNWQPSRRRWMLDSGAFTVVQRHGKHLLSPAEWVALVRRASDEIGSLDFAAPQDWKCEPPIIAGGWHHGEWFHGTGLSVAEHQRLTVANLLDLRMIDDTLPIRPTLQGWEPSDYLRCWELYERAGIHLEDEPVVLLGSMCRRQGTAEAEIIVRSLRPLRLHGFGVKTTGLARFADGLVSADSATWSRNYRYAPKLPGCEHRAKNCANCPVAADRWLSELNASLDLPRWRQHDLFDRTAWAAVLS